MRKSLHDPLELRRRQEFLNACNGAFEVLRKDPRAWAKELEERAEWECTLSDGLEDDDWATRREGWNG